MGIPDFKTLIPKYVLDTAKTLNQNGFLAYLVGGSVRDLLLGKTPKDYDIATNAYPEEITKIFPKSIPTGAKFGTITVVCSDEFGEKFDIEVTTFRSEEDYINGRWPTKVTYAKKIEDDLARRDFTINAIAIDLLKLDDLDPNNDVVDPFGGKTDLKKKVIKAVGNAFDRFSEDGLRGVRACRLASQLQFEIEQITFESIKQTLHVTKQVSIERFREELEKLLYNSPKPSVGLKLLAKSGILELFIPELLEGVAMTQPQYHVDDVFTHTIKTVDEAEDVVKLAALFHDIAKPRCYLKDEKGVHFYGHDLMGAEMTKLILKRLKFSNAVIEETSRLVRWHMFYYPSVNWREEKEGKRNVSESLLKEWKDEIENNREKNIHGWSDAAIRRLIINVGGEDAIEKLMKLRIADAASNPKSEFNPKELDILSKRISSVRAKDMALKVSDLDITGTDLMQNFNLEPGKLLGDILKYLLDKVVEDPAFNKKMDLLLLAKEFLEKNGKMTNSRTVV